MTDELLYLGYGAEVNNTTEPTSENQEPRYHTCSSTPRVLYGPATGNDIISEEVSLVQNFIQGVELVSTFGAVQLFQGNLQEQDTEELLEVTKAHNRYYITHGIGYEVQAVGAGVGGGFTNTTELMPIKYQEAINGPDGKAWAKECDNEHNRMLKNKVFSSSQAQGSRT